jgi:hypothetical protein
VLLVGATLGVFLLAAPAFAAGSVTQPSGSPIVVPGDANGNPLPFTLSVTGMPANVPIFVVECDGVPSNTQGYVSAQHCDPATNMQPVVSDGNGNATFDNDAGGGQTGFNPTKGALVGFNCIGPSDSNISNGQTNYKNCQIKIGTSVGQDTSDQIFATLQFPNNKASVPEVPYAVILPAGAIGIGAAYFVIRKRRAAAKAAA